MKELKTLKAVYSYMFPEVRRAVFDTFNPGIQHNFQEFEKDFLSRFFSAPDIMDSMHVPVLQKWVKKHSKTLKGIAKFASKGFMYPTAGSEEGIREFMSHLMRLNINQFYVLKGEYEGYKFVGETRGIKAIEVTEEESLNVEPGWFFISNPSARNGNIISNDFINDLCDAGHSIFYDLAYLDSTEFHEFDLSHPNIKVVVMSFSKAYGLFYFRFGALFSRNPVPALYGNKWFKVVPTILIADKILDTINPVELVRKYKHKQRVIVNQLKNDFGLPFECSDAVILSHIDDCDVKGVKKSKLKLIENFRRGNGYRFCLKPYFEEMEVSE